MKGSLVNKEPLEEMMAKVLKLLKNHLNEELMYDNRPIGDWIVLFEDSNTIAVPPFKIQQKLMKFQTDPILPSNNCSYFNLFDWSEVEVARQLTLVTHFLYRKITYEELLNSQWTKYEKSIRAPNITKLIERFNKL